MMAWRFQIIEKPIIFLAVIKSHNFHIFIIFTIFSQFFHNFHSFHVLEIKKGIFWDEKCFYHEPCVGTEEISSFFMPIQFSLLKMLSYQLSSCLRKCMIFDHLMLNTKLLFCYGWNFSEVLVFVDVLSGHFNPISLADLWKHLDRLKLFLGYVDIIYT
jgi:hypothetical protein